MDAPDAEGLSGPRGLATVPIEVLAAGVLSRLTAEERRDMRTVCRGWARLLDRPGAWKSISRKRISRVRVLHYIVAKGSPEALGWARANLGITRDDALYTSFERPAAFSQACGSGRLGMVERLVSGFGLTPVDVRAGGDHALVWACSDGRADVVRWLVATYELRGPDVCPDVYGGLPEDYGGAFANACAGGHLELARWLADTIGLGPRNVRTEDCGALRAACINGQLDTAKWLTERFELGADDARARDNVSVFMACERGHLLTAQWIAEQFGLTAEDVYGVDGHILLATYECMGWDVLRWLVATFGLASVPAGTLDDMLGYLVSDEAPLRHCRTGPHCARCL